MTATREPAVWFPAVRTGTGTDVFTERLVAGLRRRGIRAEITWLPLRAEYAPWTVRVPKPPEWATVAHVSSWLSTRFIPRQLPVVATIHHSVHDPALRRYKGFARAAYHRFWMAPRERKTLRRADKVIAVSRYVAEMARKTLLDAPMEVIYNGVDTGTFHPGERLRRPGEVFRLIYVGSWMVRKGVDLLAPIMRELGDRFELRYTGGAAAKRDEQSMPANMRDIGRLHGDEVVAAAMQDADVLLFPSRSEGHPLVAIEAMACGLPVIATRGSSLVEVVEDGMTGTLCSKDDPVAFAAAVKKYAEMDQFALSSSRRARDVVEERFDIDVMVEGYSSLYRCLAHDTVAPL